MSDLPVDAAARAHAIAASGSVLVQAPAGSGKTTLLAQRFLRLLGSVPAPEHVLALTFTRRAAQEMRERVMQALAAASLPASPAGMNPQTWELGRAAQRHLRALAIDLERHPSRLRIETIDAFNAWLAGQLPIAAGAGSRLNLTDRPQLLYQEAARRALSHEEADPLGDAVERLLAQGDQRWQSLVTLISGMLPSRDRWLPLLVGHLQVTGALDDEQLRRVRRHLDEDLQLLVSRALGAVHEALGAERLTLLSRLMHAAAGRLEGLDTGLEAWRADESVVRPDAGDLPRWRRIAATLLTQDDGYRKRLTKTEGFPPHCADKSVLLALMEEFERDPGIGRALAEIRTLPNAAYDDEQWGRVRGVAQVLVLAAAELEQVFRERGSVDFPAVALAAVRALGTAAEPTDLGLRLDYRLQHILIDEFQDTSSAQLELVKLLTAGWQRGDGRSVFCVGDPMQSIYGFRQAEVRAFLELAEDGMGDVRFDVARLRSNFRSAKPLVDWINEGFSRILPRRDDRERGAIAFRPGESALTAPAALAAGANPRVVARGFANRREEAHAVAALIAEQCAAHPDWRVAVLVRARTHARDIAHSLRSRGVAFRAIDLEPLQDRPVVRDLIMLVRALLHWGDRIAWLALLRAPWAGVTLADLLHIARAGPVIWTAMVDADVLQGLSEDGRARCRRLAAVLELAFRLRGTVSVTRWVERTWLALGGPSSAPRAEDMAQAVTVFSRLQELEERGLPDSADLDASFADLYAEQQGAARVEIMTIHKAKGLEFDLVVVPALDRHIPGNRDQLLLSHEFARAGRDGLVMAARPALGGAADLLFEFLRHKARDAAALEAERLLYVACTRAKWQLHLTATVAHRIHEPDEEPHEGMRGSERTGFSPRAGSLLSVLWPVVGEAFAPEVNSATPSPDSRAGSPVDSPSGPSAPPPSAVLPQAPRGGPLRRVPCDWSPAAGNEAALADAAMMSSTVARDETPVFDWAGETARRVGSLVHAELQFMDIDQVDEAAIRGRTAQFRRWLALHGVPDERLEAAAERVVAALIGVHGDPRARWILQKRSRDDFREYALSGLADGAVVRVVFDRSFVDEAGVRWVIDYKTSQHAGGRQDEFLDREVERYGPQLHRYAHIARLLGPEPVRVGLYFPLMRAWREWAPEHPRRLG